MSDTMKIAYCDDCAKRAEFVYPTTFRAMRDCHLCGRMKPCNLNQLTTAKVRRAAKQLQRENTVTRKHAGLAVGE